MNIKKRHLILILLALLLVMIAVTGCEGQPVDPDEGEIQPDGTRLFKVPNAYFTVYDVIASVVPLLYVAVTTIPAGSNASPEKYSFLVG